MKLFDFITRKQSDSETYIKNYEDEVLAKKTNMYVILEIFSSAYAERFKKLNKSADNITTDQSLYDVTNGDLITTSHMVIDMHEALNVKLDYLPGDEYSDFETVGMLIQYFLDRFDYRINIENPQMIED